MTVNNDGEILILVGNAIQEVLSISQYIIQCYQLSALSTTCNGCI